MVRLWKLLLALCVCSLFLVNCTREVEPSTLDLVIPIPASGGGSGSLSGGPEILQHVIINLRLNNTDPNPVIISLDYEQGQLPYHEKTWNSSVNIVVPGAVVPASSTLMIQYLGVFGGNGNGMSFFYGSVEGVDVTGGGVIQQGLDAFPFGPPSAKEGRVIGRYDFDLTAGTNYPTGSLVVSFSPPALDANANPHPEFSNDLKLEIERSDMVSGYFDILALSDSAKLDYEVIADDGNTYPMFPGTASNLTNIKAGATGQNQFHFTLPESFNHRVDGDFASGFLDIEHSPEMDLVVGYFGDTTNQHSTGNVCVEKPTADAGLYPLLNSIGNTISYKVGGGDDTQYAVPVNGGNTNCSGWPSEFDQHFKVLTQNMDNTYEGLARFRGPFRHPFAYGDHPPLANVEVTDPNTPISHPQVKLSWKYLDSTAVSGAKIFARRRDGPGSFSSFGDEDGDCLAKAFNSIFVCDVIGSTETTNISEYDSCQLNLNWDNENPRDYEFAVCPYRTVLGEDVFFNTLAVAHGVGHSGSNSEVAYSEADPEAVTFVTTPSTAFPGWTQRITNTARVGGGLFTDVTLSGAPGIAEGDEVLIQIVGMANSGECGNEMGRVGGGNQLGVGHYGLFRAQTGTSGANLRIASGSFVDELNSQGYLAATASTTNFCYAQAVQVMHFGILNFGSTGNYVPTTFDYAGAGGGVIALRADKIYTNSSDSTGYLNASLKGFSGGVGSIERKGAGTKGDNASVSGAGDVRGESAGTDSGGGGGANGDNGGSGGLSSAGGTPNSASSSGYIVPYFGGGGATGGNVGGGFDGAGGGMVYATARLVELDGTGTNPLASANGGDGATDGGGGGAGGSINLILGAVTGSGTLKVEAYGGNGTNGAVGTRGGGGGGSGGVIQTLTCGPPPVVDVGGGAFGTGASAPDGGNGITSTAVYNNPNLLCY